MARPEYGTAPIKCAKRGCTWRGFETELDEEDGRQDMIAYKCCPECGCHDYYFVTEKEVAKWERDKEKNETPNNELDKLKLENGKLRQDADLCKKILCGFIDHGGIPNWVLGLTPNLIGEALPTTDKETKR